MLVLASVTANSGMRVLLLTLVIVAVLLLLAGAVIALLTLYNLRHVPSVDARDGRWE